MLSVHDKDIVESLAILDTLKSEVRDLRRRCDAYEAKIERLESRCETYEQSVENYREEVARLLNDRGVLETSYRGDTLNLR
jgi:hypothetical protein